MSRSSDASRLVRRGAGWSSRPRSRSGAWRLPRRCNTASASRRRRRRSRAGTSTCGPTAPACRKGRGSVAQGQAIYDEKCASCHGTFGESNSYLQIAGGVGSLATDQPVRTTGSKLNYATTLWDYINRAMPFNAPQTLASPTRCTR